MAQEPYKERLPLNEKVFENALTLESAHPAIFYERAVEYWKNGMQPEAAFLFYLGQLRYTYFNSAAPNLKPDGDGALLTSLNMVVGQIINDWLEMNPVIWVAVIEEVLIWDSAHNFTFFSKQNNYAAHNNVLQGLKTLQKQIAE
jgi:hypothetical protein